MAWAILERTDLIKDEERYGLLSALRPTFMTKNKDMLDTVRRLTVRATCISAALHIFTFKAQRIIIRKKTCL